MMLSSYLEELRHDLAGAAAAGGPDVARAGDLLAGALEPALRLCLLDVLTGAAEEIAAALPGTSLEVRLHGRDPEFVVSTTHADPPAEPVDADSGTARLTLRLPESLKTAAERAAAHDGVSVNGWLVAAVKRALDAPAPRGGPRRRTGYARS